MNWRSTLLSLGLSIGIVIAAITTENTIWVGEECIPNDPDGACSQLAPTTRRSFYWSLDQCKQALSLKTEDFVCASGPNPDRPEEATAKSFRKTFVSSNGVLEQRKVPRLSIVSLPLASAVGVLIFLLGQIGPRVFATIKNARNVQT